MVLLLSYYFATILYLPMFVYNTRLRDKWANINFDTYGVLKYCLCQSDLDYVGYHMLWSMGHSGRIFWCGIIICLRRSDLELDTEL